MSKMTTCEEGHSYDQSRNATCPFCDFKPVKLLAGGIESRKLVEISPPQHLVVGWLVGLDGSRKGQDFQLYAGVNRLSLRSEGFVRLAKSSFDVSDDCAHLTFDVTTNSFILTALRGETKIRVNHEQIRPSTPHVLLAYDVIDVGGDRLMFMALCGDRFSW